MSRYAVPDIGLVHVAAAPLASLRRRGDDSKESRRVYTRVLGMPSAMLIVSAHTLGMPTGNADIFSHTLGMPSAMPIFSALR